MVFGNQWMVVPNASSKTEDKKNDFESHAFQVHLMRLSKGFERYSKNFQEVID